MDKDKVQGELSQLRLHEGSWLEHLLKARYTRLEEIREEIDHRIRQYKRCDDLTKEEQEYLTALSQVR